MMELCAGETRPRRDLDTLLQLDLLHSLIAHPDIQHTLIFTKCQAALQELHMGHATRGKGTGSGFYSLQRAEIDSMSQQLHLARGRPWRRRTQKQECSKICLVEYEVGDLASWSRDQRCHQ